MYIQTQTWLTISGTIFYLAVEYKVSATFVFILVIFMFYETCQPILSRETAQSWYTEQVKVQGTSTGEQM